jgi:hypothetical protein
VCSFCSCGMRWNPCVRSPGGSGISVRSPVVSWSPCMRTRLVASGASAHAFSLCAGVRAFDVVESVLLYCVVLCSHQTTNQTKRHTHSLSLSLSLSPSLSLKQPTTQGIDKEFALQLLSLRADQQQLHDVLGLVCISRRDWNGCAIHPLERYALVVVVVTVNAPTRDVHMHTYAPHT